MSIFNDIPDQASVLHTAITLQQAAAKVGFDWQELHGIVDKIQEELEEVTDEIDDGDPERLQDEIGDLLFAVTNLARHLAIDPDQALAGCNRKFQARFRYIEQQLEIQGKTPGDMPLDELDKLWEQAKTQSDSG